MIRGVVFTHADLGIALCRAMESMMGQQQELIGISNEGLGGDSIKEALAEAAGGDSEGTVVFTALYGGSCWRAAEQLSRERGEVVHVTGVNLPMLMAFVNKRESKPIGELADMLVEYGRGGIRG